MIIGKKIILNCHAHYPGKVVGKQIINRQITNE